MKRIIDMKNLTNRADRNWKILIEELDIKSVPSGNDEKEIFVNNYQMHVLYTDQWQDADKKIGNITNMVGWNAEHLHVWEMDRLKDAAFNFINGCWLSTIAICGCICEFIAVNLTEQHIELMANGKEKDEATQKYLKANMLIDKIKLMKELDIIDKDEKKILDEVRERRNEYLHLDTIDISKKDGKSIKDAAAEVLNNMILLLNARTD